jgi:PAS domain S-box-containing protein
MGSLMSPETGLSGSSPDTPTPEHLLRAIVESSDDAIISNDLAGRINSWNKSAERMFGYSEAEVLGRPVSILIPPDRRHE